MAPAPLSCATSVSPKNTKRAANNNPEDLTSINNFFNDLQELAAGKLSLKDFKIDQAVENKIKEHDQQEHHNGQAQKERDWTDHEDFKEYLDQILNEIDLQSEADKIKALNSGTMDYTGSGFNHDLAADEDAALHQKHVNSKYMENLLKGLNSDKFSGDSYSSNFYDSGLVNKRFYQGGLPYAADAASPIDDFLNLKKRAFGMNPSYFEVHDKLKNVLGQTDFDDLDLDEKLRALDQMDASSLASLGLTSKRSGIHYYRQFNEGNHHIRRKRGIDEGKDVDIQGGMTLPEYLTYFIKSELNRPDPYSDYQLTRRRTNNQPSKIPEIDMSKEDYWTSAYDKAYNEENVAKRPDYLDEKISSQAKNLENHLSSVSLMKRAVHPLSEPCELDEPRNWAYNLVKDLKHFFLGSKRTYGKRSSEETDTNSDESSSATAAELAEILENDLENAYQVEAKKRENQGENQEINPETGDELTKVDVISKRSAGDYIWKRKKRSSYYTSSNWNNVFGIKKKNSAQQALKNESEDGNVNEVDKKWFNDGEGKIAYKDATANSPFAKRFANGFQTDPRHFQKGIYAKSDLNMLQRLARRAFDSEAMKKYSFYLRKRAGETLKKIRKNKDFNAKLKDYFKILKNMENKESLVKDNLMRFGI